MAPPYVPLKLRLQPRYWTHHWRDEINALPHLCGVYVLLRQGRAVYVGQSANIRTRLQFHRMHFEFDTFKVSLADCDLVRYGLERKLIYRLRPERNRAIPLIVDYGFPYGLWDLPRRQSGIAW